MTPGQRLRQAVDEERPLQVAGAVNAFAALQAADAGFRAVYLSGAGVANASHALPDLAITTLADVAEDARRVTAATGLPLLADIDTGFGSAFNIARTMAELGRAGVAGVHLEDQVAAKRCGHRPGKALVSAAEMADRVKAAADANRFGMVLMARTDAHAVEGLAAAIDRANAYLAAGAEMIFAEALTTPAEFAAFCAAVPAPVLANATEFGKTPLLRLEDYRTAGVRLVLYPLSAFRAMAAAAAAVYAAIRRDGDQAAELPRMMPRSELYRLLDYHSYEDRLDRLFSKEPGE